MKEKIKNFWNKYKLPISIIMPFIVLLAFLRCFLLLSLEKIYNITSIWTIIITLWITIQSNSERSKQEKLNHSIDLVNNFDNSDLRSARKFTRAIQRAKNKQNFKDEAIFRFIEDLENMTNETQDLFRLTGISSKQDRVSLQGSLIYLFNYWQSVYAEIKYETAEPKFLIHNLNDVYIKQYERFRYWLQHKDNQDPQQLKDLENLYDLMKKKTKTSQEKC